MCRNIKLLFNFEPPVTDDEIRASARQYVRKISGMPKPSGDNAAACDAAVEEIVAISRRLLREELTSRGAPRDREVERVKARARGKKREARMRATLAAEEP